MCVGGSVGHKERMEQYERDGLERLVHIDDE
jgi:hypothetical protein